MRDDFNQACQLIKTVETSDNGVLKETVTTTSLWCSVSSNIRAMKNEAGTVAHGIELKVKLPDISCYGGERYLDYDGDRYEITRTYQDGEMLELTCVRGVR